MGVRLYPDTEDQALLCKLAGVPESTAQELAEYNKSKPSALDQDAHYKHWEYRPENVARLEDFQTFGWGRVSLTASRLIEEYGHDNVCGSESDPERVRSILKAQLCFDSPLMDEVKAVCWG